MKALCCQNLLSCYESGQLFVCTYIASGITPVKLMSMVKAVVVLNKILSLRSLEAVAMSLVDFE